jgi:tripartite-type tricarboxylate transporter receptor subunit TctC
MITVKMRGFSHRLYAFAVLVCVGGTTVCNPASAQTPPVTFPTKPITLVVGYPPGGSTDLTGRAVAEALSKILKQPVIVENIGGAGGALGAQKVVNAAPDGYTLLLGANNEIVINKLVSTAIKYDGTKDLAHIGLVASQPMVLVAAQKTGVKTPDEFIAAVKPSPGKFSYGSSGVGTALHLAGEMIKETAGLFMVHIPYRGVAPLTSDIIGGSVEYGIYVLSSGLPQIKAGKVNAIGVTTAKRSSVAPNIPALSENPKFKGVDIESWFVLAGPKSLPPQLAATLKQALQSALQDPALRKRLEESGSTLFTGGEDASAFVLKEQTKYKRIVQFADIKE